MCDPGFQREVGVISESVCIDNLTANPNMAVAHRVRQIVVPSGDGGDVMVSPLHPLGLSIFAGDIFARQNDVLFAVKKREEKSAKRNGELSRPFFTRLREANEHLSQMQNTGISLAGKKMARMKNFPPPTVFSKEWLDMAHPMRLSLNHPAIQSALKTVAYRHAYVMRRGGSVGNGDALHGKQTNRAVIESFAAGGKYLVSAMRHQLLRRRETFLAMDDMPPVWSWSVALCEFMTTPSACITKDMEADFADEAMQSIEAAAEYGKVAIFDMDREIIRRSMMDFMQEKEA